MPKLEFFFDYGSSYSYMADSRLAGLAARTGATIEYRPFLLGGVFKATGNTSPATLPAKGVYSLRDLQRWADHYGIPFRFNPFFPINTLRLMRAATAALQAGVFPAFNAAMWRAMWVDEKDLGDDGVLRATLAAAGLDGDALLALAESPAVKEALKATTQEAVDRGAFGAPAMFVGDELFWGNDRLDFVEAALKGVPA